MTSKLERPHLYVLGEVGVDGPVKIGLNAGSDSASGRAGLGTGNWRELEVLCRRRFELRALRWSEWLVHRRLRPYQKRGEWFAVRHLVVDNDWCGFLDGVLDGSIEGLDDWRLVGDDGCELDHMVAVTPGRRHFDAYCTCGDVVRGGGNQALPTVQKRFAFEHLGLSVADHQVTQLEPQVDKMVDGKPRPKGNPSLVQDCC